MACSAHCLPHAHRRATTATIMITIFSPASSRSEPNVRCRLKSWTWSGSLIITFSLSEDEASHTKQAATVWNGLHLFAKLRIASPLSAGRTTSTCTATRQPQASGLARKCTVFCLVPINGLLLNLLRLDLVLERQQSLLFQICLLYETINRGPPGAYTCQKITCAR